VFATLASGLGTLPDAVAAASGAVIRTRSAVRELSRTATGWRLVAGSAAAPEEIRADAVVLAVPARAAGRLLAGVTGAPAAALASIEYASMAIVTLAYPRPDFPAAEDLSRSGYLVPAVDGHAVKAVTYSTIKWPHLTGPAGAGPDEPVDVIRCSVGRIGEESLLQRSDEELAALAAAELARATGARGKPIDARVTRWGGGLPQYTVGHLDRVAAIRAGVAAEPGLAVCGAAYDGVGIPACVATARAAAAQVVSYLQARVPPRA
jgi:oxygen-dependent protoporphyrinogen oxidase